MTIAIRSKSWVASAKLSPELETRFDGMAVTLTNDGAFVIDNKTGRSFGPFPHLGAMSSLEIGRYFDIPPKFIIAWLLVLSSGIEKFRYDQARKVIDGYRCDDGLWKGLKA